MTYKKQIMNIEIANFVIFGVCTNVKEKMLDKTFYSKKKTPVIFFPQ